MKDQERLKKLLLEIKGERSIRRWAIDTGVSASTLSNYINDKVRGDITPQTLRKLVDSKTHPRGNVSLGELYIAGGYEELQSPNAEIDRFLSMFESENPVAEDVEQEEKKKTARIMKRLIESEVALSKGKLEIIEDSRYCDRFNYVTLKVRNNTSIKKWIVVIDVDKLSFVQMGLKYTKFGRLLYIEAEKDLKVSLFTSDKLMYEQLSAEKAKMAYKYDFSVILFDEENVNASEDMYLSYTDASEQFDLFSEF